MSERHEVRGGVIKRVKNPDAIKTNVRRVPEPPEDDDWDRGALEDVVPVVTQVKPFSLKARLTAILDTASETSIELATMLQTAVGEASGKALEDEEEVQSCDELLSELTGVVDGLRAKVLRLKEFIQ